jgi:lytic murein transglycosylase
MRRVQAWVIVCVAITVSVADLNSAIASCGSGPAGFSMWLEGFKKEAMAAGISQNAITSGLGGVIYSASIISKDRHQGVFHQSFEQFSGRMVPPRLGRAQSLMKSQAPLLAKIERQYGVPGTVLVAIWGLETDFGAGSGNEPTMTALATLAYDCRRSQKFNDELLDALRLIDRGYLSAAQMHGAWAGELGQTQFMPSSYLKYAVGRHDLIHSVPDVLASTANYLRAYGWHAGQSWGEGTANFQVLLQWNSSTVYTKTVAYFATKLSRQ